jgi:hypothetical protein
VAPRLSRLLSEHDILASKRSPSAFNITADDLILTRVFVVALEVDLELVAIVFIGVSSNVCDDDVIIHLEAVSINAVLNSGSL